MSGKQKAQILKAKRRERKRPRFHFRSCVRLAYIEYDWIENVGYIDAFGRFQLYAF